MLNLTNLVFLLKQCRTSHHLDTQPMETSVFHESKKLRLGGGSLLSSLALLSLSLSAGVLFFLVFLAFFAPTRDKIPSDVHQDCIKSITNLCCFSIHVGLVLEVSLMDVNHLRLFFGSEIPICLKVENILHILSKNASQVARNKLR